MKSRFLPAAICSASVCALWGVIAIYVISSKGVTSFHAGEIFTRLGEKSEWIIPIVLSLFVSSILQIVAFLRFKPPTYVAWICGLVLPPIAALVVYALPLLQSGSLRGESGMVLLLPIVGAQIGCTAIPPWIVFSILLRNISKARDSGFAWKGAFMLAMIAIAVPFSFLAIRTSKEAGFAAIKEKNVPKLISLLDGGLDPNAVDYEGTPLLHYALFSRSFEATEVLLKHGANADYVNPGGYTALSYVGASSIVSGSDQLFDLVLGFSKNAATDEKAFWNSLLDGDVSRIKKLVERGSRLHIIQSEGVLRTAIDKRNSKALKALIELGSDVNAVDPYLKRSPLMLAASVGAIDMVKILVEAGADIQKKDRDGRMAVDYAQYSSTNKDEIIQYLAFQ